MAVVAPPLQLTPQTRDHATAVQWLADYRRAAVGIEGLVAKGRGDPYQPGRRGWGKGSSATPRRRWPVPSSALSSGHAGWCSSASSGGPARRRVHDRTAPRQQSELTGLLTAADTSHPWPGELVLGWGGSRDRVEVVRVQPRLVVEVLADTAVDAGRWRHAPRFVRARPDLSTGNG